MNLQNLETQSSQRRKEKPENLCALCIFALKAFLYE